jgi:hypothetical protein
LGKRNRSVLAPAVLLVLIAVVGFRAASAAVIPYTIVPGGSPVTVTIATSGDDAAVTFDGTAGQRVSLALGNVTIGTSACCSTKVSLLKPDGTTLVAPTNVGTSGGFIDTKTLPVSGSYTIFVDPQGTATGSMTLTLHDVPADVSGTIVAGGPALTVTTTAPGQNAKLTFSGTAGQRVSLQVGPICCSTKISILKPDGTALVSPTTFSTSGGFIDVKTLPVSGSYAIVVDPQSSAAGSVTVKLHDVPPDVAWTIVPGGPPVTVTATTPGQNAKLTFSGTAGNRISLSMTGVTMASAKVSILNPDGTSLVAATTVNTAGAFFDTKTLATTGTYSIVVDPQVAATGNMTLRLYDVPADASVTAAPGGAAVTVTAATPGQNAKVMFDGAVNQRISVQLSGVTIGTSTSSSMKVSILKPDGTTLIAPRSMGTSGGFIDAGTLTVAGTYTIFIDPQSSATGSATVTVNDVTDTPTPIVPGGPAVTVTTTTAGQNARLTFDGTAGGRVSLAMTSVTISNSTVSILKPDGTALVMLTGVGKSGGFVDATSLPETGTYTILVDPQGTATGKMTLKLYDVPPDIGAAIVPGGAAVRVTTSTPGQNARLTFDGTATQRVFLKMTSVTIGSSTCCSTKVSMLKPDGTTLVAATSVGTSGGFIDTTALPTAGTYTIVIDPQTTSTGGITLTLNDVPPDPTDTAVPGGPAVSVTTTAPGQNARVTFDGVAGRQVSLDVDWAATICCLVKISITAPDGSVVLSPFTVGATGAFIDARPLPVTGTYTILVDPQDSAAGTTTLTLHDVPPDVTAAVTPGGPAVTLTTTAAGQNARFTFSGAAGDGALVTVGPNCCATNVSILKPDGTTLVAPVGFAAAGGTLTGRLSVAGTYTILVDLQGQVSGSVTVRLDLDSGAPDPPVLTISEAAPDGHANGATFYYRPGGTGGTFTVDAATSDGGTGVQKVTFPGLSGGFTPTIATSDPTAPYNQAYNWGATATFSGNANTVTAYDKVGNTSTATFSVVRDSTPPATTDDTASIGSAWKNTSQTVTLTPSDALSGVAATYYTTNGSTPTTGSTPGTLVTLSADGVYTVKYFSVDNVGNAEPAQTAGTQIRIDKTTPASAPTFPAGGARYNASGWSGGCAAAGICGTASDALSGVQKVELSIQQGAGNYWNGTAFTGAGEVFLAASGTTAWSYAFPAANFPADGAYTVRVRATDNAGNVETPVSRTFTYDSASPETTITAAPPNPSNAATASFSFGASETGSSFQCSLDGAAFASCTSPKSYSGLAAGSHTFQVRATDAAGNTDPTPAAYSWTIDLSAPDTTITSGPPTPTQGTSASFSFTSSEAGSTFQCSLDAAAFASCTSPKSYTGVATGTHTFRVKAIDPAGNIDATPATYTWTIDQTPPDTTIIAGPANPTNSTSATFAFNSSEPGSTHECSVDGAAFTACTSPQSYSGLGEGSHTFQVRATDAAGNTDGSPATRTWTIDLTPPETTITAGPSSPSNSASATFSFSSSEAGSTFRCSLDSGTFSPCTSPTTYAGLTAGAHTFQVRASDPATNTDVSPATYSWTIDLTAPETTIGSGPPTPTTQTTASFSFAADEAGSSFECSLDGASFTGCTSPQAYSGLGEGAHTFRVRAMDPAGNTDATPATYSWTVDLTAPETTVDAGPSPSTNQTGASFAFSANEAASFQCSLDGAPFSACSSPEAYSGLAEGGHTFEVRATDAAGNTDLSPATHSWTVDLTPPETTIGSGPADPTADTSASFGFTADEPGSSFECSLDAAAFTPCSSPQDYTGLPPGGHVFEVRAIDPAGNPDASPATYAWTVT